MRLSPTDAGADQGASRLPKGPAVMARRRGGPSSCVDSLMADTIRLMMKPYLMAAASCCFFMLMGQVHAASPCPPGFAQLQASDTCVRISGRVRADTIAGSSRLRSSDKLRTETGGRVQLDVRKQTEYGPLRAVIRVDGIRR